MSRRASHPTLTPSQENYLERIFRLSRGGAVRIRAIAEAAGVRRPSVTRAIAKLAAAGLVRHQSYGQVEITAAGVRAAEAVIRRDDCLTTLLVRVLAMEPEAAKAEVCRLEHVLGVEVLARLELLVEQAVHPRSRAWLKALHARLGEDPARAAPALEAGVGKASLHAGRQSE